RKDDEFGGHASLCQSIVYCLELSFFIFFPIERFNDADAGKRFLKLRIDLIYRLLDLNEQFSRSRRKIINESHKDRHDDEQNREQFARRKPNDDDRSDKQQRTADKYAQH